MTSDLQKTNTGSKKAINSKISHRARVINNKDEKKLQRIQVTIQSIMEETDEKKCLWVLRDTHEAGFSPSMKTCNVPEIGTEVEVFTKDGKEDVLYYRASIETELTQTPEVFDKNYPATVGRINSIGDLFRYDKTKDENDLDFYRHVFSQLFRIDKEGHMYLHIPGNLTIRADNIYFRTEKDYAINTGGKYGLKCESNFEIESLKNTCSISAKGGTLGINGGPNVMINSGVFAGIINDLVSAIKDHVKKVKEALSKTASQVTKVLSKDKSARKRIAKE